MKRMNKQVYVAVLMALTTMSINSYAADVTMNNNEEEVTINVTANRTALLDLDTPVLLPKRIYKIAALRLPLMRSPMYRV